MPVSLAGDFTGGVMYELQVSDTGDKKVFTLEQMKPDRQLEWLGRVIDNRLKNNVIDQETIPPANGLETITATHRTWVQAVKVSPDGGRLFYWGKSEGLPTTVARKPEITKTRTESFLGIANIRTGDTGLIAWVEEGSDAPKNGFWWPDASAVGFVKEKTVYRYSVASEAKKPEPFLNLEPILGPFEYVNSLSVSPDESTLYVSYSVKEGQEEIDKMAAVDLAAQKASPLGAGWRLSLEPNGPADRLSSGPVSVRSGNR